MYIIHHQKFSWWYHSRNIKKKCSIAFAFLRNIPCTVTLGNQILFSNFFHPETLKGTITCSFGKKQTYLTSDSQLKHCDVQAYKPLKCLCLLFLYYIVKLKGCVIFSIDLWYALAFMMLISVKKIHVKYFQLNREGYNWYLMGLFAFL